MSMAFVHCGWMLLSMTPNAVLLSVSMGVLGCLWPILLRSWLIGMALWVLMYSAPSSALAVLDMMAFRILETLCMGPLLHGFLESLEQKKCPPVQLRAAALLR
jgi:hypothetical protein